MDTSGPTSASFDRVLLLTPVERLFLSAYSRPFPFCWLAFWQAHTETHASTYLPLCSAWKHTPIQLQWLQQRSHKLNFYPHLHTHTALMQIHKVRIEGWKLVMDYPTSHTSVCLFCVCFCTWTLIRSVLSTLETNILDFLFQYQHKCFPATWLKVTCLLDETIRARLHSPFGSISLGPP